MKQEERCLVYGLTVFASLVVAFMLPLFSDAFRQLAFGFACLILGA